MGKDELMDNFDQAEYFEQMGVGEFRISRNTTHPKDERIETGEYPVVDLLDKMDCRNARACRRQNRPS